MIKYAIYAIFSANIISVCGVGAVSLQSEKRNFVYMLISAISQILSIIVVGMLYYLLEQYVLIELEAEFLKLFIIVCFSCVASFISKYIIKASSKEHFFYYEKCYGLPVQTAVTAGTLLLIDFTTFSGILDVLYSLSMFAVGFLLVQIIFYGLYERLDNNSVIKPARNVPLMLYILSVLGMCFYVITMVF